MQWREWKKVMDEGDLGQRNLIRWSRESLSEEVTSVLIPEEKQQAPWGFEGRELQSEGQQVQRPWGRNGLGKFHKEKGAWRKVPPISPRGRDGREAELRWWGLRMWGLCAILQEATGHGTGLSPRRTLSNSHISESVYPQHGELPGTAEHCLQGIQLLPTATNRLSRCREQQHRPRVWFPVFQSLLSYSLVEWLWANFWT